MVNSGQRRGGGNHVRGGGRGTSGVHRAQKSHQGAQGQGCNPQGTARGPQEIGAARVGGGICTYGTRTPRNTQDPEFYQYLQQSDPQLLAFGNSDDDDDDDDDGDDDDGDEEDDDEEDDDEATEQGPPAPLEDDTDKPAAPARVVQARDVEGWCAGAREGSLGAMRSLVKAFRVACHYGDSEESFEGTMRITSSATYNTVMMFMLKEVRLMLTIVDG